MHKLFTENAPKSPGLIYGDVGCSVVQIRFLAQGENNLLPIRLNVGALIVQDERILLIECNAHTDLHYNLPGGGVEVGETLYEALRREVREETTAALATIGEVAFVWEYVPHRLNQLYGPRHKVAVIFFCTLQSDSTPQLPEVPDEDQTGVVWMPLAKLAQTPLLPNIQASILAALQKPAAPPIITLDQ